MTKCQYESASKTLLTLRAGQQKVVTFWKVRNASSADNGGSLPKSSPIVQLMFSTQQLDDLEGKTITTMELLLENESVVFVTAQGEIYQTKIDINQASLKPNSPFRCQLELKAANEDGIIAASVSPMQDALFIVTKNNTLLKLDMNYDLIDQMPLQLNSPNSKAQINGAVFAWRPDGTCFNLGLRIEGEGCKFTAYDTSLKPIVSEAKSDPALNGLVKSVSEKFEPNMKLIAAWQPSGGIIAGCQKREQQWVIIFWEKNGLRHLQFVLDDSVACVHGLNWSQDSKVLLVDCVVGNQQPARQILLYHRSNYHWYLKTALTVSPNTLFIHPFRDRINKLLVIESSKIDYFQFYLRPFHAPQLQAGDQTSPVLSTVIDGKQLHVTDLSRVIMPPPMCQLKLQFKSNILAVTQKGIYCVCLTEASLESYNSQTKTVKSYPTPKIAWATSFQLIQVTEDGASYKVNSQNNKVGNLNDDQAPSLTHTAVRRSQPILSPTGTLTLNKLGTVLSTACTSQLMYDRFLLMTISSTQMFDKLYLIDSAAHSEFFHQHLRTDEVTIRLNGFQGTLYVRQVEKGSVVLGCARDRVVMQLPRGNLETIFPKVLLINKAERLMREGKYRDAFVLMRTHKLDLNLLHDLCPSRFKDNCGNIMTNIKDSDHINLFVSQLKEGLSSEVKYALSLEETAQAESDIKLMNSNKTKFICEMISEVLRVHNYQKYLKSIFTAQIKIGRIGSVLSEIKVVRDTLDGQETVKPPHKLPQAENNQKWQKRLSEDALEYVCWLIDPTAAYQAALLTYDLDLAAMAARYTQKDPKEYIPYLEALKAVQDDVQRKARICLDLKKYPQVVKELSKGSQQQVAQALELIKKHSLFTQGIEAFSNQPNLLKQVKEIVVQFLLSKGEINEAFRLSYITGSLQKCLDIALKDLSPKKAFEALIAMRLPREEYKQKLGEVIIRFKDNCSDIGGLGRLHEEADQFQEALDCYLRGNDLSSAFKLAPLLPNQLFTKVIKESLSLKLSLKKNEVLQMRNNFLAKVTRLENLQKHKELIGEKPLRPRDSDDMYSDISAVSRASSVGSGTAYTVSTTTGFRKKKDKKKNILSRNVKEGSQIEEPYIIAFLNDIRAKVPDIIREVKSLVQHLIYADMGSQARELRDCARDLLALISREYKPLAIIQFQRLHPEARELYGADDKADEIPNLDGFDYII